MAVQPYVCITRGGRERRRTAHVVVHAGLGEHGVVLDLRLADRGRVVADDDQLGCSTAKLTFR